MENLFVKIGEFGRFQKLSILICGLVSMYSSMVVFSTIFILAEPDLICKDIAENSTIINNCLIWENSNQSSHICKYDRKYYGNTLTTEWSFTCSKKIYSSLTQTFYMFGTFSACLMGFFADKYGRKRTCSILVLLISLNFILIEIVQLKIFNLSISAKYFIYSFLQFLNGILNCSIFTIGFILLIEFTTPKYSTIVSNIFLYIYVLGEFLISIISFFFRDWHIINWFLGLFGFFVFTFISIFLSESPAYFIGTKKYNEAYLILKKIANFNSNGSNLMQEKEFLFEFQKIEDIKYNENAADQKKPSVLSYIFESKLHILKIISLSVIYFSLALVYYGVSLGITSIGNFDPYFMFILSSLSELIGYLMCHLNDKINRKYVFIFFMAMASIMCLLVAVIPETSKIFLILFASIGKAMASAAFNSSYVYTSYMFPALYRNTLFLLVSSIGRLGSIISPQINLLRTIVWKPLPYIIFSFFSLIGCLFISILPEPNKNS